MIYILSCIYIFRYLYNSYICILSTPLEIPKTFGNLSVPTGNTESKDKVDSGRFYQL